MTSRLEDMIVVSPFMPNISQTIVDGQARVFEKLGVPLEQVPFKGKEHGDWMDEYVRATDREIIAIADIDAFPISREGMQRAFDTAVGGGVFGLAHVANHKDPDDVYAGPILMTFAAETYRAMGSPSLRRDKQFDAAQGLSAAARAKGIALDLAYPNTSIRPVWPMSHVGVYGIGTFYGGNQFFHLFQSRKGNHVTLFEQVADDVLNDRPLDFARYLGILDMKDETKKKGLLKRLLG